MNNIILVGFGGFAGALLRYELSKNIKEKRAIDIPIETFFINIIGAFFLNLLLSPKFKIYFNHDQILFLTTGFLGAYTTFSTFSAETVELFKMGKHGDAFIYMFFTVLFGIIGGIIGFYVGFCL
ncbi:MAG: fluoride efflux transporter CrcB [Thermoanaerobacteraceae bacterium]